MTLDIIRYLSAINQNQYFAEITTVSVNFQNTFLDKNTPILHQQEQINKPSLKILVHYPFLFIVCIMQKNKDGNVKVVCRFRPLNNKEIELGTEVIQEISNKSTVRIKDPKVHEPLMFNLDHMFDTNSTQQQIYEIAARPVVSSVLEGFNGTIFAYGQTSSGKTHTMQGYNIEEPTNKGIIPRMVQQVFSTIYKSPENIEFRLKVSIVELYMQKIRDLLDISKQDLKIRSHTKKGIYIEDATQKYVSEVSQLYHLMSIGNQNRASCSTNMNERSSRSHMIFLITISQTNLTDLSAKTGKLFLVDLAGSEKISKTGAQGQVLNEAKKINLSLTTLGKVIKALTQSKSGSHIPYRQSKLTRILQQSLGGNSKTTLVITCSPHPTNLQETISTLRFGVSAKKVSNKAKINRELTVGQLQQLLEKAERQIASKDRIINILQKYITDELKAQLPSYQQILKTKQPSPKKAVLVEGIDDEEELLDQEESLLSSTAPIIPQIVINNEVQQRIHILEKQLQSIKDNLQVQTEKLNDTRLNYNLLHTQNLQIQKQSQLLKNQIKQLRQDKARLKSKIQQLEAPKPFVIENNDKQFAKLIINQILQTIESEEAKVQLISKLKSQKWFSDMETEVVDLQKFLNIQRQKVAAELNKMEAKTDLIPSQSNEQIKETLLKVEADLDQLYGKYYDIVSMQSTWKAQCQLYERKMFKKCQRVKELQELIEDLKKQLDSKNRKDSDTISVFQVTSNQLVKPIRGGSKLFQF